MKHIYIVLTTMMLLCLAPMPYGYFMLVRFVAMMVFGASAYNYYSAGKASLAWTFVGLALLFQPFFKIVLGRVIWNVVDVLVAIFLIILVVREREAGKENA
ncbi:DUF6804 family protein [Xylanibacter brevis]|uniref:DUF6804 family protein n=1 Tax=Xylanibacter brevis TaxID=83231 RepID=UPI00048A0262|nr:DUF6804 family protein [Xylanibacter brevis]